jgi:hypothetical protein
MCSAIVHPLDSPGRFEGDEFVIAGSYFEPETTLWYSDRAGIRMTFWDRGLPLERLARAHEDAGLLLEAIREPRPSAEFVQTNALAERRLRIPLFFHVRAVKA